MHIFPFPNDRNVKRVERIAGRRCAADEAEAGNRPRLTECQPVNKGEQHDKKSCPSATRGSSCRLSSAVFEFADDRCDLRESGTARGCPHRRDLAEAEVARDDVMHLALHPTTRADAESADQVDANHRNTKSLPGRC